MHNPGQPVVRPVQEVGLHDQQQALVLGALRRATGTPVSYAELREAGVEFPASVVSELELAGVPIERCRGDGRGASVRLDPAWEPPRDEPDDGARSPVTVAVAPRPTPTVEARPRGRRSGARVLASAALLAVIVAVGALVASALIGGGGGGGGPGRARVVRRQHPNPVIAVRSTPTTATTSTTPLPPPPPPTPVSLGLATHLEARGHGLLESGSAAGAVAVLRRALLATGED
ncbi:MAG: hypothetical protein JO325_00835, partial [Solirubrobacterales bacterium]|nr:hypothetical protein [Solirubrobacterales bacterium]